MVKAKMIFPQTLEECFEEILSRGYLVTNFFQYENEEWVVTVRGKTKNEKGERYRQFGYGDTPLKAMKCLYYNMRTREDYHEHVAKKKLQMPTERPALGSGAYIPTHMRTNPEETDFTGAKYHPEIAARCYTLDDSPITLPIQGHPISGP